MNHLKLIFSAPLAFLRTRYDHYPHQNQTNQLQFIYSILEEPVGIMKVLYNAYDSTTSRSIWCNILFSTRPISMTSSWERLQSTHNTGLSILSHTISNSIAPFCPDGPPHSSILDTTTVWANFHNKWSCFLLVLKRFMPRQVASSASNMCSQIRHNNIVSQYDEYVLEPLIMSPHFFRIEVRHASRSTRVWLSCTFLTATTTHRTNNTNYNNISDTTNNTNSPIPSRTPLPNRSPSSFNTPFTPYKPVHPFTYTYNEQYHGRANTWATPCIVRTKH